MHVLVPWLLVLALMPRVEDPWPDTIGVELPFFTGTAGGVLAGAAFFFSASEKRDRAIGWGGFVGFCVGASLYCIAYLVQVVSAI